MGIPESWASSINYAESFARSLDGEDIPLKLNESLSERKRKESLRIYAIALCCVSVVLNLVLCILSFIFASVRRSPATLAFGADCVLDLLSSLIVIWRYFGSPYRLTSSSRETKACICLGALFVVAGLTVIVEGTYFLCNKEAPKWFTFLVALAAVGCCACVTLGIAKYILSKKLQSQTLFLDALNSFLSGFFAVIIIVSDVAFLENKSVWFLDPLLSIVFSVGFLAFGVHTIVMHTRNRSNGSATS